MLGFVIRVIRVVCGGGGGGEGKREKVLYMTTTNRYSDEHVCLLNGSYIELRMNE